MREEIQIIMELGQQASGLARSAGIESARLLEAQKRLAAVAAGMSVLAEEAAEVAAGFQDKVGVIESDLRPPAQMIVQMTGILKRIKELSETVEKTLLAQNEATQGLAMSVGAAVGGGARITSRIVTLAEAIRTVMPMVRNKGKIETELASLTARIHDFVAHFRDRRGSMATAVCEATPSRLLGKPPSIN
jgi:hypothetical protein